MELSGIMNIMNMVSWLDKLFLLDHLKGLFILIHYTAPPWQSLVRGLSCELSGRYIQGIMNIVSWLYKLFILIHYLVMVLCMNSLDIISYQLHILVNQLILIHQGKLVMVDILIHSLGLLEMV